MLEISRLESDSSFPRKNNFEATSSNSSISVHNNPLKLKKNRSHSLSTSANSSKSLKPPSTPRSNQSYILQSFLRPEEGNTLELEKIQSFNFSKRNFYPRKNNFKQEKKKINPFDYFSNNYFPAQVHSNLTQEKFEFYSLSYGNSNNNLKRNFPTNEKFSRNDQGKDIKKFKFFLVGKSEIQNNYSSQNFSENSTSSTKSTSPNFSNDQSQILNSSQKEFCTPPTNQMFYSNPSIKNTRRGSFFEENPLNSSLPTGNNSMKKGQFVERQGDWICMRCKNLNFSFRIVCNRCKIAKGESEMLYEDHLMNIMNVVRFNEIIQKNILLTQGRMPIEPTPFPPVFPINCMFPQPFFAQRVQQPFLEK